MDSAAGALDNAVFPNDLSDIPPSEPCRSRRSAAQSTDYSTHYEKGPHCADGNGYLRGDDYSQHSKNALDAMLPQER